MTYRCIAIGGPQDGQLFNIKGLLHDTIIMNDPTEMRNIFTTPDTIAANEPISLHRYIKFNMVFPSEVKSRLVFFLYDGKA